MLQQPYFTPWMHAVWFTHDEQPALAPAWRADFFAALERHGRASGIYVDLVRGMDDHVHILFRLGPAQTLAQVMAALMEGAAAWLDRYHPYLDVPHFAPGYAAASVSPDRIPMLRRHLRRQEKVHSQQTLPRELWELDLHPHDTQCLVVGLVNGPVRSPVELISGRVGT